MNTIIKDIAPKTKKAIKKGNKIFGAAILKKSNLSLVCVGTNNEIINPLWHGEMSTLKNFFELPVSKRNKTSNYIFLSTHEPCSLCLSAITWSGFDNFYYFFPYSKTKYKFNIPHDLKILKEIFKINNGNYNKKNFFWKSNSIVDNIKKLPKTKNTNLVSKINIISQIYDDFSLLYQKNKSNNNIPLK